MWLCDEVGNTMRRYVLLLDNVSFDNPTQRKKCLEGLGNKGIRRAKIHEVWDAATILLPTLRDNTPCGSVHDDNRLRAANNFADKVLRRLKPVYGRFDVSLRKAESRVCLDLRRQWKKVYQPAIVHRLDSRTHAVHSSRKLPSNNEEAESLKRELQAKSNRGRSSRISIGTATSLSEDEAMCTICNEIF